MPKAALIANSRSAWCCFSAEMPYNAMYGMPERLRDCVEKCGEFINYENMNQSLFVFLLLHAIEGAINFGTPCMVAPARLLTLHRHPEIDVIR